MVRNQSFYYTTKKKMGKNKIEQKTAPTSYIPNPLQLEVAPSSDNHSHSISHHRFGESDHDSGGRAGIPNGGGDLNSGRRVTRE